MKEKCVDYICNEYGTIENFISLFRTGKLNGDAFKFAKSLIKRAINIDQNTNSNSNNYDLLVERIFCPNTDGALILYSIKGADEILTVLSAKEKMIIERRYGLRDGKFKTLCLLGDELKVTDEMIRWIEGKALNKLSKLSLIEKMTLSKLKNSEFVSEEDKAKILELEQTIDKSNFIFKTVDESKSDLDKGVILEAENLLNKIKFIEKEKSPESVRKEKLQKEIEQNKSLEILIQEGLIDFGDDIINLGLSSKSYNALKRAGIHTIEQFLDLNSEEMFQMKMIGQKCVEEMVSVQKHFSRVELMKYKKVRFQNKVKQKKEKIEKVKELLKQYDAVIVENNEPNFKKE